MLTEITLKYKNLITLLVKKNDNLAHIHTKFLLITNLYFSEMHICIQESKVSKETIEVVS